MHILMKYLAIKLFILFYLFFPKSIYTSDLDCSDSWYNKNIPQLSNEIINIKASMVINNDTRQAINLYIDRDNERFRIDYDNQILILDQNKSIKFFVNTNQLYIDNPDTALYNIVSSIFIGKYFNEKNVEVIGENQYLIKNYLNFNKIEVAYSNDCFNIEYIDLVLNKIDIQVDEINVKIINDDIFFDLSSTREYFEYDLRHDN